MGNIPLRKHARPLLTLLILLTSSAPLAAYAGVDWLTYGYDGQRGSYNRLEKQLAPATVPGLTQLWSFDAGAYDATINPHYAPLLARIGGQAMVAAGVEVGGTLKNLVVFGDNNGVVYALDANPPTASGSVVWAQPLGNFVYAGEPANTQIGIRSAVVIHRAANGGRGAVYVPLEGAVHALDLITGAELAGWPVSIVDMAVSPTDGGMRGAPNLLKGELYVVTSSNDNDVPPYYGRIVGIDTATATIGAIWYTMSGNATLPTASGGGIWGWGGVAIDPLAKVGGIYVATGNSKTGNGQMANGESIVNLSPSLAQISKASPSFGASPNGYDNDYGSTPMLFRPNGCPNVMMAALNKTGQLVVDMVIANGTLSVLQSLQVASGAGGLFRGTAAWDPVDQLVLVTSALAGPAPFAAGLLAFRAGPGCSQPLSLAWQTSTLANGMPLVASGDAISSPSAANGVAYFPVGGHASSLFAVATASAGAIAAGQILWQSPTYGGCSAGLTPTVVDGRVIFGCEGIGRTLHVFGLPAK
jgi:hypothetical protein